MASGLSSPVAARSVADWMAVVTLPQAASTGVNLAFLSDSVESTRNLLALNSGTSAESVRATGCGSSMLSLATVSLLFQVLMNSHARPLVWDWLVIIQTVPGPPTVNDGPLFSVGGPGTV